MTTSAGVPICESYARLGPCGDDGFGTCCEAFPGGIPDVIYMEGADHRKPIDGDHGIRWTLSSEAGAAERFAAWNARRN